MSTKVPLRRVLRLCDPRSKWPWNCPAPDADCLARLLGEAAYVSEPIGTNARAVDHIGRVRYLAKHGWSDAIELDVGVPCLGYAGPDWPVTDGNHRLWAAAVRGDELIDVDIAGQVDHAAQLLGVSEDQIIGDRSENEG